jgi:integrase
MAGEGSLFKRVTKRPGRPDLVRHVAQTTTGPRSRRRIETRTCKTRQQAKDALRAMLDAGRVERSPLTVGDYLEQWVRDARNIRPTTRHGYLAVVRVHLVPSIGHIHLDSLQPSDVEAMLAALTTRMSPKSLRNVHVVLRRALGQAVRASLVSRNVASREFVDAPRVPVAEPRCLSTNEVQKLIAVARGDWIEAIVVVALGTGLRQGELLGAAWEDVDFAHAKLHVRKELVYRDGKYHREEPKTERSRRTVPLAEPVLAALLEQQNRLKAAGFVTVSSGPVFVNRTGGVLSGSWVTHHLYDLMAEAGIQRLPFKNLRTTFASRLYEAGVPDRTIADLLGHTRTRTTQTHYIATTPESAIEAVAKLVG